MKTLISLFLLCGIFALSYSQTVKLKPSNPSPRVGEKFSIDFDIDYPEVLNLQSIIKQDSIKPALVNGCSANNYFAKGSLRLNNSFNDTGTVSFGPFTFNIDNKEYKSETIYVKISPKLPNVKTGFWVRFYNYNGENYIITEQRLVNDKEKTSYNPIMPSHSGFMGRDDGKFAVITDSTLLAHGLEQKGKSTSSGTDYFDGKGERNELEYVYKTMIYIIVAKDDYDNNFQLSKEHFENLPSDMDFKPIAILINKK